MPSALGLKILLPTTNLITTDGGVVDGSLEIKQMVEPINIIGNSSTAQTINLNNGSVFSITLTDNCEITFSGFTTGKSCSCVLILKQDEIGNHAITFVTQIKWMDSTIPTLTTDASKNSILSFMYDGSDWYGVLSSDNI